MGDCLACGWGIVFYSSANNKMDLLHNKKEIVMAHLIDKDALVAKIERLIEEKGTFYASDVLYNLEDFLDTLEVKEVDLDAEINEWQDNFKHRPTTMGYKETARHFFELGLKAQKGE